MKITLDESDVAKACELYLANELNMPVVSGSYEILMDENYDDSLRGIQFELVEKR